MWSVTWSLLSNLNSNTQVTVLTFAMGMGRDSPGVRLHVDTTAHFCGQFCFSERARRVTHGVTCRRYAVLWLDAGRAVLLDWLWLDGQYCWIVMPDVLLSRTSRYTDGRLCNVSIRVSLTWPHPLTTDDITLTPSVGCRTSWICTCHVQMNVFTTLTSSCSRDCGRSAEILPRYEPETSRSVSRDLWQ